MINKPTYNLQETQDNNVDYSISEINKPSVNSKSDSSDIELPEDAPPPAALTSSLGRSTTKM